MNKKLQIILKGLIKIVTGTAMVVFLPNLILAPPALADCATLSGSGTSQDPYLVNDLDDLILISQSDGNLCFNKHYIQTADIDASATNNGDASNDGLGFLPIAADLDNSVDWEFNGVSFSGSYDGNGYEISNLFINRPQTDYIGLFGDLASSGEIRNLTLRNANITGRDSTGILAGNNAGWVSGCASDGTVSGRATTGGFIGGNYYGTITDSHSNGNITGSASDTGGFVGDTYYGSISNCYSSGHVNGVNYTGGFVGFTASNTIDNSHSSGEVSGNENVAGFTGGSSESMFFQNYSNSNVGGYRYLGGFVGMTGSDSFIKCFSTGNITGDFHIGGFVGYAYRGIISDSYSIGDTSGDDEVGGFSGHQDLTINNSYSLGTVTGSTNTGGFTGKLNGGGSILNSFWNTETSSQISGVGVTDGYAGGLIGLTSNQMKSRSNFIDAGWNFTDDWHGYPGEIPFLQWEGRTDVKLSIAADEHISAGEEVSLTITVTNSADGVTASDIVLSDNLPSQVSGVMFSTDSGSNWSSWAGSVDLGDLDAGSSIDILIRGTISESLSGSLSNTVTVNFSGKDINTANNSVTHIFNTNGGGAPVIPTLISPTNGATGVSILPTLSWNSVSDPDGDTVTYAITICENSDLSGCNAVEVNTSSQTGSLRSGFGPQTGFGMISCFLLVGLWLIGYKRFKKNIAILLIAGMFFISCAPGGGGSGDSDTPISFTPAANLNSLSTYYWQITADDGRGGNAKSEIWSFTTE